MRELEFLPDWYPRLRRKRAAVIANAIAAASIVVAMLIWTGIARLRVLTARNEQSAVNAQFKQTTDALRQVDELSLIKRHWDEQGEVMEKLGLGVESTRLIASITQATPDSVSLTGLNMQTEEKVEQIRSATAAKTGRTNVDRALKVRLTGIAPSDGQVADLMAKLSAVKVFRDVSMTYSKDGEQNGRLVREFEVNFKLDLNVAGGS